MEARERTSQNVPCEQRCNMQDEGMDVPGEEQRVQRTRGWRMPGVKAFTGR